MGPDEMIIFIEEVLKVELTPRHRILIRQTFPVTVTRERTETSRRWPRKPAGQSVDQPTVAVDRALLVE